MIEPQCLHAVGETLAGQDQLVKLFDYRHVDVVGFAVAAGVVVARPEQIRIEHARYAVFAQ
ncbi:hypothetical protein D3C71_2194110 [compost metagenome]